jgi:ABC-2 type transport system ATP-binding protein
MPEPVPAVEVRELVKRYHGQAAAAVCGVSLEVRDGELFCLLGPNGAGKSTILSILTTTLAPDSGSVRIVGHDVVIDQALVRRELGVVLQQPSIDLNLTAEQNLRMHAVLYGLVPWRPAYRLMPAAYRRRVAELAELLGLEAEVRRPARALSGGMRRRLEIARALMHNPRVLILDEPTAGLDPDTRHALWDHLNRVRRERILTIVFTTHQLDEAALADTACVLRDGSIAQAGPPATMPSLALTCSREPQ